ncbi:TPA: primosomal protein [Escherichia coli]|uniref:HP1 family phage holin n=1 Tax=Escherichia TaxID=561 RepID=UPI0017C02F17|nr:HP1 family phage holin [Escherichia coli]EFA7546399.1 primosomal protein [Escherichia coli]EFO3492024.1 primosomal protein [Escherichia coli]MBY3707213.1 primosomal protein [Escherichia coli]HAX2566801.1 primosomal protein [Escherichia coli]HBI4808406.1 primosomal protein [Escherichia coli]
MGLSVEKITTFFAYWLAVGLAYFGAMSPEKLALYVGSACAIFTALTNYWFKRKTYRYPERQLLGVDFGDNLLIEKLVIEHLN